MSEIIKLPNADIFGNCPKCGSNNGVLETGQSFWCVCHKHKFKWWVGSDSVPGREEKYKNEWKNNTMLLNGYRKVKPLYRFPQKK